MLLFSKFKLPDVVNLIISLLCSRILKQVKIKNNPNEDFFLLYLLYTYINMDKSFN